MELFRNAGLVLRNAHRTVEPRSPSPPAASEQSQLSRAVHLIDVKLTVALAPIVYDKSARRTVSEAMSHAKALIIGRATHAVEPDGEPLASAVRARRPQSGPKNSRCQCEGSGGGGWTVKARVTGARRNEQQADSH